MGLPLGRDVKLALDVDVGHTTPGANPLLPRLTVTLSGTGTGGVDSTPAGISGSGSALFPGGSTVSLDPTADPGSTFVQWSGDATGTDDPLDILMDRDKTIDAQFDIAATTFTRAYSFEVNDVLDNSGGGDDLLGIGLTITFQGPLAFDYDTKIPSTITLTDIWVLFDDTATYGTIDGTGTLQFVVNGVNTTSLEVAYDVGSALVHVTGSLVLTADDLVYMQSVFGTATQCPILEIGIAYTRTE